VVYELHPGALGGFAGITKRLASLKELGITAIELMPIADFPGRHNWGYDGVLPFAPDAAYGTPDELKRLIDTARGLGMMVMLDVVYNHFGPDGNYLHAFAKRFFREDLQTPWGVAIDFRRDEVRDYFIQNALYWLMEYRFDGLRFDAVHAISEPDFLDDMARIIRATVEPGRHVHLVLEHEGNKASHLAPELFDAQWTDDLHHCLHVLLTDEAEGYYEDFQDAPRLLARCLAEGFAYQGEVSPHSGRPRGEPSAHLPTTSFVICLQNHDQIGNRAFGDRLTTLARPKALRAATALVLLAPFIPMLFMGEEWGAKAPFLFFTDHDAELAKLVREGRRKEFQKFAAFADPARRETIPDPNAATTFASSVPDPAEAEEPEHAAILGFHRDLLALRHRFIVPYLVGASSDGAEVIGPKAVVARWRLSNGALLTIAVNLDETPVPIVPPVGEMLYGTDDDMTLIVPEGALPGDSAVIYLAEPHS
jgi:maltooligosyltrehalose trehalohydrolase